MSVESLTISELRRCLRDLFAVATLPAVWAGADARKIAQTLGDALARALDADVVYVLVDEVVEGHLDVRLPDAGEHPRGDAERFLRGLITAGPGSCTCELFGVALNAFVDMIDLRAKQGGVVVAARRAAFPSATEQALLRVAVNQASVALETVGYVAELQRIAKTKEALVAELENGSRRKDEFLAMLGHELRNPLAAIHAAHEQRIAAQDAGRPDQIIGTQLTTLRRLVDDLLDVSRIATGKLVLSDDIVDVRAAVSRALVACEHAATQKGIALSARLGDARIAVSGDAVRIEQAFVNVIGNAIKYTPPGGHVSVDASVSDQDVVVTVTDDGCGISAELLPRIFDPFVQAETSSHRAHGGLGLGLALVKGIVELHSGNVTVASDGMAKGCVVEIRFRLAAVRGVSEPQSGTKMKATPGVARRVLLVDDNADITEMLAFGLEQAGHATAQAADGVEALEVAKSFSPDVAFVDIGLPGLDGHEVGRRLRSRLGGRVLLVAMSGYGQPEDVARTRDAGFDHHLVKPVPIEHIKELVAVHCEPRALLP
jgi:signal transduction histidine kinase/ActR/RegA family two-component response regulator